MALLAKLKTSKKERSTSRESVETRLRRKMIDRLMEQRKFAEADLASTIEAKDLSKLPEAIDLVVAAVEAGELDKPLKAAMDDRRSKLRRVK